MRAAPPAATEPTRRAVPRNLLIVRALGAELALDAAHVRAVRALPHTTRIPHPCRAVLGVFHHEGRMGALVDLERLAGGAPAGSSAPPARKGRPAVVILVHENRMFGLLVAGVEEVIHVPAARREPRARVAPPAGLAPLVDGVVLPGRSAIASEPAAPPAESAPELARLLAEAPGWLARIHDSDPTQRARANETRARSVLGEGNVHLLDPARIWAAAGQAGRGNGG